MSQTKKRTTIVVKMTTKAKLDSNKAPGQCYDGFLCQLIELWEKTHDKNKDSLFTAPGITNNTYFDDKYKKGGEKLNN